MLKKIISTENQYSSYLTIIYNDHIQVNKYRIGSVISKITFSIKHLFSVHNYSNIKTICAF